MCLTKVFDIYNCPPKLVYVIYEIEIETPRFFFFFLEGEESIRIHILSERKKTCLTKVFNIFRKKMRMMISTQLLLLLISSLLLTIVRLSQQVHTHGGVFLMELYETYVSHSQSISRSVNPSRRSE